MGGFEGSTNHESESMGPSSQVVSPLAFFVANDGSMSNLILPQTMCCVICHCVCQSYSVGNTIKRRKCMISYN
jgi:hypothetical protein